MKKQKPNPYGERPPKGSEEAIKAGCICTMDKDNENWTVYDANCPVHDAKWIFGEGMR